MYPYEPAASDDGGGKTSRLSRFTVVGDTASPGTEKVLAPVRRWARHAASSRWARTAFPQEPGTDMEWATFSSAPTERCSSRTGTHRPGTSSTTTRCEHRTSTRWPGRSCGSTRQRARASPITPTGTATRTRHARRCGRTACATPTGSRCARRAVARAPGSRATSAGTPPRRSMQFPREQIWVGRATRAPRCSPATSPSRFARPCTWPLPWTPRNGRNPSPRTTTTA